jgi:hypothetical protein
VLRYCPSGLPDGTYIFKPKIPIGGKFCRVIQWKIMVYFKDLWSILFYEHLLYFMNIWYFCGHLVCRTK